MSYRNIRKILISLDLGLPVAASLVFACISLFSPNLSLAQGNNRIYWNILLPNVPTKISECGAEATLDGKVVLQRALRRRQEGFIFTLDIPKDYVEEGLIEIRGNAFRNSGPPCPVSYRLRLSELYGEKWREWEGASSRERIECVIGAMRVRRLRYFTSTAPDVNVYPSIYHPVATLAQSACEFVERQNSKPNQCKIDESGKLSLTHPCDRGCSTTCEQFVMPNSEMPLANHQVISALMSQREVHVRTFETESARAERLAREATVAAQREQARKDEEAAAQIRAEREREERAEKEAKAKREAEEREKRRQAAEERQK
jgi:hypothetical protein